MPTDESPLETTTDALFESVLGIKGEAVTLDYIRSRRQEREYPVDHSATYRAHIEGRKELTGEEVKKALVEVDALADYNS